jgi:circadian clock protein KaiC
VLKSRGMKHSNQIREFLITAEGIELLDVYLGPEGVLTGSMRAAQEAREKAATLALQEEIEAKQREVDRLRAALAVQSSDLSAAAKRRGADESNSKAPKGIKGK